jgi:hypothetical protein
MDEAEVFFPAIFQVFTSQVGANGASNPYALTLVELPYGILTKRKTVMCSGFNLSNNFNLSNMGEIN